MRNNKGFISLALGCILLYLTILGALAFLIFHHGSSHGSSLAQVITPGPVSVPEPGSLLMLAAGLAVVGIAYKVKP